MMSRKDYVAIAGAFAYVRRVAVSASEPAGNSMFWMLVAHVADVLAADNPNFDRDRFVAAARGE